MKKIRELLKRRKQWERMYSPQYVERFFTLYDGELEALLTLAARATSRKRKP